MQFAAVVAVLTAGCVSTGPHPAPGKTGSMVDRLAMIGVQADELVDPAAVTPEMADWIRQLVPANGSHDERVRLLLSAVTSKEGLALQYDSSFTGTASEVFQSRKANCLAFTHLVVGLGRELGLPVYYLGFRQQPRYEREGSLVVVWEHVTAGFGPPEERLILQLAVGPQLEYEDARQLPDRTALAMYYSNRGAEMLRQGESQAAREMLEIATAIDPQWSPAWVKLGVALRRSGEVGGAEEAYRNALRNDPDFDQAYHNLAALLWLRGDHDAAGEILRLLDRSQNRNPFVCLSLGDMSRRAGRSGEARRYYERAARLAPESAEPRAALGQLAFDLGQRSRAQRLLRKAAAREPTNDRVERLRRTLGKSAAPAGESSVKRMEQ